MSAQPLGLGDSWLAVRTDDAETVARFVFARGPRRTSMAKARDVLDRAIRHELVIVVPPRDGWVLVVPGLVSPEQLTSLSAELRTEVYAFEANDDTGRAIALADTGTLLRDAYECPSEGESRDEGERLDGEPDDLAADDIVDFADAHTTASAIDPETPVIVVE